VGKASTKIKNRVKAYNEFKKQQKDLVKVESCINEDADMKIQRLQAMIRVVEYDLQHSFQGSQVIQNKLNILKQQLKDVEEEQDDRKTKINN